MGKNTTKLRALLHATRVKLIQVWQWYKSLFIGSPWWRKLAGALGTLLALIIIFPIAVYMNWFWLFGKSPSVHEIMHPQTSIASEIYSCDSVLLGKYFNVNRSPVTYNQVNPIFYTTLIDTEDERFYLHKGVDIVALPGVLKDMLRGNARGGSTLTQQLVKNMFRMRTKYTNGILGKIPGVKMVIMKTKEWILAVWIELLYSKEEILTMYVNTVDFGSNAYGIKTAAKTYFNTTPDRLKIEQGAVLVGLLKATSTYNPKLNPRRSLERRNIVLSNLRKHGHLTARQCDSLQALPITLDYSVEDVYDGQALYFRQELAKYLTNLFKDQGLDIDIYGDGLKIYTTINSHMQQYAEQATLKQMHTIQERFDQHWHGQVPWRDERYQEVPHFIEDIAERLPIYRQLSQRFNGNQDSIYHHLNLPHQVEVFTYNGPETRWMSTLDSIRYMVSFMHAAFIAVEPQTRHVKAWVGDIDYTSWKYDKVTAMRQPGSTFKAFVYATAFNQGMTPCETRRDTYFSLPVWDKQKQREVIWAPHNANGYCTETNMTLRAAFAQSVNTIAARLANEVGIDNVAATARAMGIQSQLDPTPALSLGSSDVNLAELVNAYTTIVANGQAQDLILVDRIIDRNGKEIYNSHKNTTKPRQAIPYRTAYLMQQLLQAGLTEPGATSMALWTYIRQFDRTTSFGGKTGTSNNHSDAWYIGITPALVGGAWVGGEYRSIHFRTGALGQGSRTALPIWGYFLQSLLNDPQFAHYQQKFPQPTKKLDPTEYTCPNYIPRPDSLTIDSVLTTLKTAFHTDSILNTTTANDNPPSDLP